MIGKVRNKYKLNLKNRYTQNNAAFIPFVGVVPFGAKWEEQTNGEDVHKRVIAKRCIAIFKMAKPIDRIDVDLYFKLTEKIIVYDGKLVVCLLDGSEVECENE